MQDSGTGPELWLLTGEVVATIPSHTPRSGIRFSLDSSSSSTFFFFFSHLPPSRSFIHTFLSTPWQHDGSRTCTFGIILFHLFNFLIFWSIMVRYKCSFPRSCSWGFIQSDPGFPQRDGYKWVRGAETFCCWDFRWVWLHYTVSFICRAHVRATETNPA